MIIIKFDLYKKSNGIKCLLLYYQKFDDNEKVNMFSNIYKYKIC